MRGIKNGADHLLPFSLAPTVHDGNAHEIGKLAHLAYAEGGDITPNNLRSIPGNNMEELKLTPSSLIESLRQIGHVLKNEAPQKLTKRIAGKDSSEDGESPVYRKTVCGAGHSVVAIDHNGDVFPCHLLERPELLLGNALMDEWPDVLESAKRIGVRCSSLDIPKCSSCHFATTCAGGCRADAFFHHGTFLAEDSLCEFMYYLNMKNLMDLNVEKSSDHIGTISKFDYNSRVICKQ
jgi:radical SAM protein with 4Fe4S-binding SPASM domain